MTSEAANFSGSHCIQRASVGHRSKGTRVVGARPVPSLQCAACKCAVLRRLYVNECCSGAGIYLLHAKVVVDLRVLPSCCTWVVPVSHPQCVAHCFVANGAGQVEWRSAFFFSTWLRGGSDGLGWQGGIAHGWREAESTAGGHSNRCFSKRTHAPCHHGTLSGGECSGFSARPMQWS